MSAVAPEVPPVAAESHVRTGPAGRRRSALARESVVVFGVSYAFYAVVGYLVMLQWHIIVGDGVSRLAHAYFVWYNEPPKLAAIGFVWPPLMTIVLLPLAAIKPVATSLLALPLTSALFGAALVVVLDRTLVLLGMSRRARLPLVAAIALNPMIVYYAANGMGEVVYLFLLSLAVYAFLRWTGEPRLMPLVLSSFALTLGLLTRYEIVFWALALGAGFVALMIRRGATRREIEGSALTFAAPIAYGFALWLFFNWLILGDPLWWLHAEVTQTFVETRRDPSEQLAFGASVERTLRLTWDLFPATFVVVAALLVVGALRREIVSLVLAVVIALNPLTTAVLGVTTQTDVVFQLRYNIRVVPLVLIGLAWLWVLARPGWSKSVVWGASLVLLVGSTVPMWRMMQTHQQQALEQAFTRAVTTFEDQEGKPSLGIGVPVGNAPERAAAEWILANVDGRNAVLADDALSFEVILFTGRPSLFLDRTDEGDEHWFEVRDAPRGRVAYFLVSTQGNDRIRIRYPGMFEGDVPWLRLVYTNERWTVFRVEPARTGPA